MPIQTVKFILAAFFVALSVSGTAAETLRVGTAGDYMPVTVYDPATGNFSGTDIDLIRAFAADSGYEITFVKTTWPTWLSDLKEGKFQMAIGGISWTADRAKEALLSDAITTFGKVALSRCAIAAEMGSLSAIDRHGTRVVSNRGGTNERFALANVKNAILTILPNNELPFEYLRAEVADVMFTDSIEADYLAQRDPRLCVSAGPFTENIKVAAFRKDESGLLAKFNAWLANHKTR